jgi:SAM-dependent methyltransferase
MRERMKWAAIGLWLLVAFLMGRQFGTRISVSPGQLDLNHPLRFAIWNGRPFIAECSERIVEIPFVHHYLPYPFRGRVLDVGSRESELSYELTALGFETWSIDIRPELTPYPALRYIQGDVRSYAFPADYFDVVISLSTIEHIGLHAYGNIHLDPDGDLHALQAMSRATKPGGTVIVTTPFGRRGATETERIYDHEALQALLQGAGLNVNVEEYWRKDGIRWLPATWQEAEKIDSVTPKIAQAVACVVARRPAP